MTPEEYNLKRLEDGEIEPEDLTALIVIAQKTLGVRPDGYCGPVTLDALRPKPPTERLEVEQGRLFGPEVSIMPIHQSWFGGPLKTPGSTPLGIVVHTSATGSGSAVTMAKNRQRMYDPKNDRLASWHISVETGGQIIQQVDLRNCAWHAGSQTAKRLDFGWANYTTLGIELISKTDKNFPQAQVEAAKYVWRAIVRAYGIPRERAMITHASIDPTRRKDPGEEWMAEHAPKVLDFAFA